MKYNQLIKRKAIEINRLKKRINEEYISLKAQNTQDIHEKISLYFRITIRPLF